MALIFTAGGKTETLDHYSIKSSSQRARTNVTSGIAASSRGATLHTYGQRDEPQKIRVDGVVKAASGTALDAAFDGLVEVLNSGPILLEDTVRNKFGIVHKLGLSRQFVPPSLYRITLDFALIEGTWSDNPDDSPLTYQTTATVGSTKLVRYAHVTLGGTAPAFPYFKIELTSSGGGTNWAQPWIEWRGRNLLKNSSFEEGASTPTHWSFASTPVLQPHYGRSGARCVRVSRSGATYNMVTYGSGSGSGGLEIDASTQYAMSFYARKLGLAYANANYRLELEYYDASGASISNDVLANTVTSHLWARITSAFTTPATCAYLVPRIGCNADGESLDIDDVQVEKGATASSFVDTSIAENRHVAVRRLVEGAWDDLITSATETEWVIDARNRRFRSRASGNLSDDGDVVEGKLFDLYPGLNHVYVNAPSTGTLTVTVDHPSEYY